MTAYRCILLGQTGQVEAVEEFVAITNGRALKIARSILRHGSPQCVAFELWLGDKIVHAEPRAPDPNPTA